MSLLSLELLSLELSLEVPELPVSEVVDEESEEDPVSAVPLFSEHDATLDDFEPLRLSVL